MNHNIKGQVINQYLYPKLEYALKSKIKATAKTKAIMSYFKIVKSIYGFDILSYKDLNLLGHDKRNLLSEFGC